MARPPVMDAPSFSHVIGRLAALDFRGLHTPVPFLLATGNWRCLGPSPKQRLFLSHLRGECDATEYTAIG